MDDAMDRREFNSLSHKAIAESRPAPQPSRTVDCAVPAVHAAIRSGKLASIRHALASTPDGLQVCNRDGDPPLHFAIRAGMPIAILECLLEHGARLDARNMHGQTAMHIAFGQPDADSGLLTRLLGHAGRNGDDGAWLAAFVPDANGRYAYEGALDAQRRPKPGLEPVLAALRRHDGWYRAYVANMARAVVHADRAQLGTLLAWEMPLDLAIQGGKTALMMAAELGHEAIADMLLTHAEEHGMRQLNLAAADSGDTALMLAAYHGHVAIVERLLAASAATEVPTHSGDTALMAAAVAGHDGIVLRLLNAGAAIDARNAQGRTALMFAAVAGYPAAAEVLLRHGAAVDAQDADGRAALAFVALHVGNVDAGASIQGQIDSIRSDTGTTTARSASRPSSAKAQSQDQGPGGSRYRYTSQILLDHGASVDLFDAHGATPLMHAAGNGHTEILAVLLGAKADRNHRDKRGRTALTYAAAAGHAHAVRLLKVGPADGR
jgi:ankyrin repeat protein